MLTQIKNADLNGVKDECWCLLHVQVSCDHDYIYLSQWTDKDLHWITQKIGIHSFQLFSDLRIKYINQKCGHIDKRLSDRPKTTYSTINTYKIEYHLFHGMIIIIINSTNDVNQYNCVPYITNETNLKKKSNKKKEKK